jgi:hypothetical protein
MESGEKNPRIQDFVNDMSLAIKHGVINKSELGEIVNAMDKNDKYEKLIEEKRKNWQIKIDETIKIFHKRFDLLKPLDIADAQGNCLLYRQILIEEISSEFSKRTSFQSKLEVKKQNKLLYYTMEYAAKASNAEKMTLIEGHITEYNRRLNIIDSYIDFLNGSVKTIDSTLYGVKNVIDLLNYSIGK